jgi:hypothetical protein
MGHSISFDFAHNSQNTNGINVGFETTLFKGSFRLKVEKNVPERKNKNNRIQFRFHS